MKKLLTALMFLGFALTLAACDGETEVEQGDYTPGTHIGYTEGHRNTIAVVFVDEQGFIADIFVDSAYTMGSDEDLVATTKMSLDRGCGYNMHRAKDVQFDDEGECFVEDELMWHQQVQLIVDAVIAEQAMPSFSLDGNYFDEDGDDVIAGVSISVDSYIDAINDALAQAQ